jgi:hypothetical protein
MKRAVPPKGSDSRFFLFGQVFKGELLKMFIRLKVFSTLFPHLV